MIFGVFLTLPFAILKTAYTCILYQIFSIYSHYRTRDVTDAGCIPVNTQREISQINKNKFPFHLALESQN